MAAKSPHLGIFQDVAAGRLGGVAAAVALRGAPPPGLSDLARCYAPQWSECVAPARANCGTLLVFTDDDAQASVLRERVELSPGAWRRLVRIRDGERFQKRSADEFTVPASDRHYTVYHQLAEALALDGPWCVLQLWLHGAGAPASPAELDVQLARGPHADLALLQALQRSHAPAGLLLRVHAGCPIAKMTDGLAAVLVLEHSKRVARTVYVDSDVAADALLMLAAQEMQFEHADPVRYVGDGYNLRQQRVLVEIPPGAETPLSVLGQVEADGVYVITGGMGHLSRLLAGHIAEHHGSRPVLLGRRSVARELPRGVCYISVDVSDAQALAQCWAAIHADLGPVRGIFHLAGVVDDGLLVNKEHGEVQKVFRPKVHGAMNLDTVSRGDPLDFFVCYSSVSSVLGNVGQSDYAAANAFLDAFALWRNQQVEEQARVGRTVSINWPLWHDGGMRPLQAEGFFALSQANGLSLLLAALRGRHAQVVVWGEATLPAHLTQPTPPRAFAAPPRAPTPQVSQELVMPWIETHVRTRTRLGPIDPNDTWAELGLDSLASVDIAIALENDLAVIDPDVRVDKTLLLEHASLRQLSQHMTQAHNAVLARLLAPAAPPLQEAAALPEVAAAAPARDCGAAVAVVGMAARLPKANDVQQFWQNLRSGKDCIEAIGADRWDWRVGFDPEPGTPEKSYGRHGGFVDNIGHFDPLFFGIAPADAATIDPQERLFLQEAFRACEDAGYVTMPQMTGVFVAAMFGHYAQLQTPQEPIDSSYASVANRVSHCFDLRGPSLAIDSMCSGSFTALHLACASLRRGECEVAIVGGVNLMPHESKYRLLSRGRFLSQTGHCHAFGALADGYVPGEGIVALVLKPLSRALADDDRIHAVIRGSAINSGGKSAAYHVPSLEAQARVIASALADAQVSAQTVSYVEAHGTGTRVGDPIEVRALSMAFAGVDAQSCRLGSVKSNVGHLEAAAGLAGLVKVILQLQHRELVASLHHTPPNDLIDFAATPFRVQSLNSEWSGPWPLRAGLSSFGAGGANAHVVVEEAPPQAPERVPSPTSFPLLFSASTPRSLQQQLRRYAAFAQTCPDDDLGPLAYTLALRRRHFAQRRGFVVSTLAELYECLQTEPTDSSVAPLDDAGVDAQRRRVLSTRNPGERLVALQALTHAWEGGQNVDWTDLLPVHQVVSTPGYAFDEQRYWVAPAASRLPPPAVVSATEDALSSALYAPVWESQPLPGGAPAPRQKPLIVRHDGATQLPLSSWVVRSGSVYRREGADGFTLDLCDPAHWAELFAALRAIGNMPDHIAFCCREARASRGPQALSCLRAAGAVVQAALTHLPKMRLIIVATLEEDAQDSALGSALASLLRSAAHEHAGLCGTCVVVGPTGPTLGRVLLQEMVYGLHGPRCAAVRYVGEQRQACRLRLQTSDGLEPYSVQRRGVVIVTGGLGKLGLKVARYLAHTYEARLVLVGRTKFDGLTDAQRLDFESLGSSCTYVDADLTQAAEAERIVLHAQQTFGAVTGVVHAAGVQRDGLLVHQSADDFCAALSPKVLPAIYLDEATAQTRLDFFICFSSVAASLGSVGQAAYACANGFLDGFAAARRDAVKHGRRSGQSLSIGWPYWHSGGMRLTHAQYDAMVAATGLRGIDDAAGIALFGRLLAGGSGALVVLPGPSERIEAKLCELARPVDVADAVAVQPKASGEKTLEGILADLLGEVLAIEPGRVDATTLFGDYGLDSVRMVELAARLQATTQHTIAPNLFFSHPTVEKLAAHLRKSAAGAPAPSQVAPQGPQKNHDAIAIVGMAGILPGAKTLAQFWDNLLAGVDVVRTVARWPQHRHFAATIADIDHFDASFFKMSAREAMLMDPQHRLFLQCAYECVLEGGYTPGQLGRTGVFAGVQFNDYQVLLQQWKQSRHPYAATGNAHAMLANRVSYLFDWHGPSHTVDTACSSALVAIKRAMESLRSGECATALVGAVSLLIDPEVSDAAKSMSVISPQHRCATFDAAADGYVRGEGVGCVLLKPLERAMQDGDPVHAVIRAVVENHGGRAHSLTAPNPRAQTALLEAAYQNVDVNSVSYVEAHGTGTKLGDPVEIDGLKQAWANLNAQGNPGRVWLGSVKSHVGHLEPAAGMASLFKTVLAMQHRCLPANRHFKKLNPLIELSQSPFQVVTQNQSWEGLAPVRAGISSFGFGGSNAHMVVEEMPTSAANVTSGPCLVTLSAHTHKSLTAMGRALADALARPQACPPNVADVATTLAQAREHFGVRAAFIVGSIDELVIALRQNHAASDAGAPAALLQARDAYLQGAPPDAHLCCGKGGSGRRVHLPGYSFDTQPYWFEGASDAAPTQSVDSGAESIESMIVRLRTIYAGALLCQAEGLPLDALHVDLGVDSLLAMQIAHAISQKVGIETPATALFTYPTLRQLAQHLAGGASCARAATSQPPDPLPIAPPTAAAPVADARKIAIIGMSGQFPGAPTTAAYWELLRRGGNAVAQVERWRGHGPVHGGFLANIADFDPSLFCISPREAELMEPQQRLMLQQSWLALEDAGVPTGSPARQRCGVFMGALPGDYRTILAGSTSARDHRAFTGNAAAVLAGRIAYSLDLRGPAVTLDTACSSSLVAMHLAKQSILDGSCDIALAGGVATFSTPEFFELAAAAKMLSPTGACKTFSAHADGFVPAEAAAVVVLKHLDSALADGDRVLAVIEASELNQDGRSNGLTAPSRGAQAALLRKVYSQVPCSSIGYIEVHGTGTQLGDPIECSALEEVFGQALSAREKVWVGSSKTNIGHALSASGMASLFKVILCMQHRQLVASLHYNGPSPHLALDTLEVCTQAVAWPADRPAAGLSAFGFSGTNAHMVLGPAPQTPRPASSYPEARNYPLAVSGDSLQALARNAAAWSRWLRDKTLCPADLGPLSYTSCCRRSHLQHRAVVIGPTTEQWLQSLDCLAANETCPSAVLGQVDEASQSLETAHKAPADRPSHQDFVAFVQGRAAMASSHYATCDRVAVVTPPYAFECRPTWLEGATPPAPLVAHKPVAGIPSEPFVSQITEALADLLKLPAVHINPQQSFLHLGVDSLVALELLGRLGQDGDRLAGADVLRCDTVAALAEMLAQGPQSATPLRGAQALPAGLAGVGASLQCMPVSQGTGATYDVVTCGQGDPVVLLAPLNGLANMWLPLLKKLHSHYQLIMIHLPGHGGSAFANESIEEVADLCFALLDQVCCSRHNYAVHVVGWSLGGCVAQHMAVRRPRRVRTLSLISTTARLTDIVFARARDELQTIAAKLSQESENLPFDAFQAGCSVPVLHHYYRELLAFDSRQQLGLLRLPTLILTGAADSLVPAGEGAVLARARGACRHESIPDGGHYVPLSHASQVATLLKSHFRSVLLESISPDPVRPPSP